MARSYLSVSDRVIDAGTSKGWRPVVPTLVLTAPLNANGPAGPEVCAVSASAGEHPNITANARNMVLMVLTFNEVVAHSAVVPSGLRLQGASNGGVISLALNGSVSAADSVEITITLTLDSANGVRALTNLAVDESTSTRGG